MTILEEAIQLDREAQLLAKRMTSDFIRIGKLMSRMTDDTQLWRLLVDPKTGLNFESQEQWVVSRFRSQRATAFEARRIYRALQATVPEAVMEFIEPGALKVLAELPESAQRNLEIQQLAVTSSAGEFTDAAMARYPDHLLERRVKWSLNPTMTQARLYDQVIENVIRHFSEGPMTREDALEYILGEVAMNLESKEVTV